jgi:hypothetical protein
VHRVFATVAHKDFFARLCELVIALEGDLAHLLTSAKRWSLSVHTSTMCVLEICDFYIIGPQNGQRL